MPNGNTLSYLLALLLYFKYYQSKGKHTVFLGTMWALAPGSKSLVNFSQKIRRKMGEGGDTIRHEAPGLNILNRFPGEGYRFFPVT
jgi:hypothetical protein